MRQKIFAAFGFVLALTLALPAHAQTNTVTGDFTGNRFVQLVNAIESATSWRIYYNPSLMDTIPVNIIVRDREVPDILAEIFAGTDFHFAADGKSSIFITRGRELQTGLPDDFFDTDKSKENHYNTALLDYLNDNKKERARLAAEAKLYEIGKRTKTIGTGNASLAGYVKAFESGEPIVGAAVYIENPSIGVTTDQFGYYSMIIPKGRHDLLIKSLGAKNTKRQIVVYTDGTLDIEVQEKITSLKEVLVESEKDKNIASLQMGVNKIDIKTMKQIPGMLGEADILRVVLALPGVQSVGEGSTGLNVRGGSTSQNLILLNDAVVYNPSHLFGFFSAFNPDVLRSAELYKSGIPAEYGGRISSVLDVTTREGNKKKFAGSGGISPITGRLTLEAPIGKKNSLLIGARSTYSDWLLKQIPNTMISHSAASFYDIVIADNHQINERNSLYFSGYLSRDHFKLNGDSTFQYINRNASVKWKHTINNKLYGVLTATNSGYKYSVADDKNPTNAAKLQYQINQWSAKLDFSYFPSGKHTMNFGLSSISYALDPGTYNPTGTKSIVVQKTLEREHALESAVYIGDRFDISDRMSIYGGLRYSLYNFLGPKSIYTYANNDARNTSDITGTQHYGSWKSIATYGGPEYRFSARYSLTGSASIKLSYNKTRQYLQMITNTTSISPTDAWKLSDKYIKPQIGDQIALGLYKNLRSNSIETSVEGYYKVIQNTIDYKSGDSLLLNKHLETAILNAHGKAYGIEFMIKKTTGKLNGWISYTYSRSFLKTQSPIASENPNNGNYYPSNYDKPHALNFIGNYKLSHRFSVSLNTIYSTGRPITLPVAKYVAGGAERLYYSERNQYRIPDYFRIDFSMNIEGNHKIKKLAHSSWTLGIYNVLGRKNPYSVYFENTNGVVKGYKLSIFGQPIPTVTYNFKF